MRPQRRHRPQALLGILKTCRTLRQLKRAISPHMEPLPRNPRLSIEVDACAFAVDIRSGPDGSGIYSAMRLSKVVSKTLRREGKSAQVAGRIDAAIAANVNEQGTTRSRTKTRQRIVQRSGRTVVSEQRTENDQS
jgi:hypothetical protein